MYKYLYILLTITIFSFASKEYFDFHSEDSRNNNSIYTQISEQAIFSRFNLLIQNSRPFYEKHMSSFLEKPTIKIKTFPVFMGPSYNNAFSIYQPFYRVSYFRDLYSLGDISSKSNKNTIKTAKQLQPDTLLIKINNAPVEKGYLSSRFGFRKDPINGSRRMHKGIDIAARRGSKVNSLGSGEVIFSGYKSGYGNVVEIRHGDAVITRYAHLQQFLVNTGQKVSSSDTIGLIGSSGRSTGPHLHLEVLFNNKQVDPQVFLTEHIVARTSRIVKNKRSTNIPIKVRIKLDSNNQVDLAKNNSVKSKAPPYTSPENIDSSESFPLLAYQDYVESIKGLYGFTAPVSFEQ